MREYAVYKGDELLVIGTLEECAEALKVKPATTPEQEYSEANKITKPSHYQDKNGKDLYQKWYEEHDMQTFRAIMRAVAERYTSRYEKKNGIEDLKKGIYTLERLREYEEREVE